MKETNLNYEDLCDISTYSYSIIRQLEESEDKARYKYEREKDIRSTFLRYLQDHKTVTREQFDCYMSWCRHSAYSPYDILYKYKFLEQDK